MTDLEALKEKWAEHDRKLDEAIRINRQVLSATCLGRAQSALRWLTISLATEAIIGLAILFALGSFIYANLGSLQFALPGIVLHVYVIGMLIAQSVQMAAASRVNYGQPVAVIQKELEDLRVLRIRIVKWGLIAGMLAWTPFVIVIFKGCFDLNAYEVLGPVYLWANVLFSLAVILLAMWMSKKIGERLGRSHLMGRLMNHLAGHSLDAATANLAEVGRFADERYES